MVNCQNVDIRFKIHFQFNFRGDNELYSLMTID